MHQLTISDIHKTIPEASVLSFEIPQQLRETFAFRPGQYLTLEFHLDGAPVRRSYSICSSPDEEVIKVGVKRVTGGLVSNHINDQLQVGDLVSVMPPDGRFVAQISEQNYKTYYLFAAGSGVTPIFSILQTVLAREDRSYVYLIYGNKTRDSIMFKAELDRFQEEYGDRLIIVHTLSSDRGKWSDLWSTDYKEYRKGRVDEEAVRWFIDTYPPYAQNAEYYICGPGKMIENTQRVLKSLDVPDSRIHSENFGGAIIEDSVTGVEHAHLTAHLNGNQVTTEIKKGETVLRALIAAGAEPPYSCEGGVCSTCMCQITKGKVHMKNNLALTDKEVDKGYILSCQSIALTEEIEVKY